MYSAYFLPSTSLTVRLSSELAFARSISTLFLFCSSSLRMRLALVSIAMASTLPPLFLNLKVCFVPDVDSVMRLSSSFSVPVMCRW